MFVEPREQFLLREIERLGKIPPRPIIHVGPATSVRRFVSDERFSARIEYQSFKKWVVGNPFQSSDGAFYRIDLLEKQERDYGAVAVHSDFRLAEASSLYADVKRVP